MHLVFKHVQIQMSITPIFVDPAPVHQQPPVYISQPQAPLSYQPGQQGSTSYQQPGGQTGPSQYPTKQ